MQNTLLIPTLAAIALLAACGQGPAEKAGEAQDERVEAATGTDYMGDGPREEAGEARDANTNAVSTQDRADAQADATRAAGEVKADRMENQADAVRDKAEATADATEEKANR